MPLSIILKVYDGGKLKQARAFKSPQIRLGTGEVELQLSGANVSSQHALIEVGGSAAILRALSSAPVFLNGQPILAAPLRTGDLITVGSLRIMVELREPQQQPAGAVATLPGGPQKRQRFQVIDGDLDLDKALPHIVPSLQVVREEELSQQTPLTLAFAPALTQMPPQPLTAAVPVVVEDSPQLQAVMWFRGTETGTAYLFYQGKQVASAGWCSA